MPYSRPSRFVALLLLLTSTTCSGCLDAKVLDFLRYDAATDTYHVMKVYQHIHGSNAEINHAAALWRNRDHVIPYLEVLPIFSKEPAVLRLDAKRFQQIEIGHPSRELPPIQEIGEKTLFSLDSITVTPGKFFLSADRTLCCYHQISVPGALLDRLIAEANNEMCESLVRDVDAELKRRAEGGPLESWDDMRQLIDSFGAKNDQSGSGEGDSGDANTAQADQPDPGNYTLQRCLEPQSLEMHRKAAKAGTLGLTRHGTKVKLSLPFTMADARQARQWLQEFKERLVDADFEGGVEDDIVWLGQQMVIDGSATAEIRDQDTLVLQIDGGRFISLRTLKRRDKKLDDAKRSACLKSIATIRTRNVPIDEQLDVEQVIAAFERGTLVASPSIHKVAPGTGLFPPKKL